MNTAAQYNIPMVDFMGKKRTIDELSQEESDELGAMIMKIYAIGSLAWDYAGTCRDIAAELRIQETKKLSRLVKQLKEDYDRCRQGALSGDNVELEKQLGEDFEADMDEALRKLNYGIEADRKVSDLTLMHKYLVKSTQMAMTMLDAMRLMEYDIRKWFTAHGVGSQKILTAHYDKLRQVLPGFAGNCYDPFSEARRITAAVIRNKMDQLIIEQTGGFEIRQING